jgi:hypothetical protein
MDETGLFWRQMPNGGLSKQKIAGRKLDKARVSLVIATNATGSDRIALWLIGRYQTPHALRSTNYQALGCVWNANEASWMRYDIMTRWLRSFYRHISIGRRVLLLMDNASPHLAGIKQAPPPPHIQVVFFPANSTSIYQPLDQGIIQNLKHQYRKKWIRWMIAILDRGLDPRTKMNLNHTLHWITQAWRNQVSDQTIQNCFKKSTLIRPRSNSAPVSEPGLREEIGALYNQVIKKLGDDDFMPLDEFLDPSDESVSELPKGNDIYTHHETMATEGLDDDSGPSPELPSNIAILGYLHDILLWAGNKQSSTPEHIRQIEGLIRDFSRVQIDEKRQVTLDDMTGWAPK